MSDGSKIEWTLADLRHATIDRQAEWCANGDTPDLSFRGLELGGEVGEAAEVALQALVLAMRVGRSCNTVKKMERERHGWTGSRATLDDLAQELSDVIICADLVAHTAGIDLMEAVRNKFNATSKKVGLKTILGSDEVQV